MDFGLCTVNYYARIYNYSIPSDMNWYVMVKKTIDEFTEADLAKLAGDIRNIGIENIELWSPHASYTKYDSNDARRIRALLDTKGIKPHVYCISTWNADDVDIVGRAYDFAAGLGVKLINCIVMYEGAEKILEKAEEFGRRYDIRLSIDNHPLPGIADPKELKDMIDSHSDYIGTCIDIGIYWRAGYHPVEIAKLFGDRLYHVRFKDSYQNVLRGTLPSGDGTVPLAELISYLKDMDYKGMVSLAHQPVYDPTEDLKKSVAYCKKII